MPGGTGFRAADFPMISGVEGRHPSMTTNHSITCGIGLEEYLAALDREGVAVTRGSRRTFWQCAELSTIERHPSFCVDVPTASEIRRIFWKKWPAVVTYILAPDDSHPPNAWLYVCEDKSYELEKLGTQARRNVRRALRRFRFEPLALEVLREKGEPVYCETRTRIGLSDGTSRNFQSLCDSVGKNPAYRILGAWAGEDMAAFLLAHCIEDWLDFSVYAANEHLNSCPNEGLIYHLMQQFLTQGNGRVVSYGLSSIQEADNVLTLDYFKKKVGFEARPVHRVFLFHPLLRPWSTRSATGCCKGWCGSGRETACFERVWDWLQSSWDIINRCPCRRGARVTRSPATHRQRIRLPND